MQKFIYAAIENGEGSGVAAEAAGESETKAEVSAQQEL